MVKEDAPEDGEDRQNGDNVVRHGHQCTPAVLPLPESEEDVQEDDDERRIVAFWAPLRKSSEMVLSTLLYMSTV